MNKALIGLIVVLVFGLVGAAYAAMNLNGQLTTATGKLDTATKRLSVVENCVTVGGLLNRHKIQPTDEVVSFCENGSCEMFFKASRPVNGKPYFAMMTDEAKTCVTREDYLDASIVEGIIAQEKQKQ